MKSCKTLVLTCDVISHIRKDKKEIIYGRKGDLVTIIAESGDQVALDNKGNKFWTYKNNVDEKRISGILS